MDRPIAILYEHPEWFKPLFAELERRDIPYVWFPDAGEVKDIRSGDQSAADATTWQPPAEDLRPRVLAAQEDQTD